MRKQPSGTFKPIPYSFCIPTGTTKKASTSLEHFAATPFYYEKDSIICEQKSFILFPATKTSAADERVQCSIAMAVSFPDPDAGVLLHIQQRFAIST
jgi:hypothetical protein